MPQRYLVFLGAVKINLFQNRIVFRRFLGKIFVKTIGTQQHAESNIMCDFLLAQATALDVADPEFCHSVFRKTAHKASAGFSQIKLLRPAAQTYGYQSPFGGIAVNPGAAFARKIFGLNRLMQNPALLFVQKFHKSRVAKTLLFCQPDDFHIALFRAFSIENYLEHTSSPYNGKLFADYTQT